MTTEWTNPEHWMELEARYYMHLVNRQPVVIARGQGVRVWDVSGKEYLDFTAGWAVASLGHAHPAVTQAIQEQAATLLQTSNQFYTVPQVQLAEALVENSCMDKVFFSNSGAEANDGAVKLARKYGRLHRNGAYEVITAFNAFHGRTLGMVAATPQAQYQDQWKPLLPGFAHVPYGDLDAVKAATTEKTCAIMVEVLQGEGGVIVPSREYVQGLREWCDYCGVLLIFDEIQTGIGRLGTLFGYQAFGVEPDVMTLAKALGNGIPVGAFLCKDACNVLVPGDHGSTFGGNPLATAAANATFRFIVDNAVPEYAGKIGVYFREGLDALARKLGDRVKEVRGMGLLLGLQFRDSVARDVVGVCNQEGLLLNPVRPDTVRFMPPLIITESDVDECLKKLERGIAQVSWPA